MFNPQSPIDPQKIWALLGSFYNNVDPESKVQIEAV